MEISKLQGLGVTCNPHKFEIPALQFPRKVPVNPCKHLQCMSVEIFQILLDEKTDVGRILNRRVDMLIMATRVIAWCQIVNVCSARRQKLLRQEWGLWQNLVANRKEMTQIKGHANAAH